MKKRVLSLILTVCLLFSMNMSTFAADKYNPNNPANLTKAEIAKLRDDMAATKTDMQKRYGVNISYPDYFLIDPVGLVVLQQIDKGLSSMSAGFVAQLSNYYKSTLGKPITIALVKSDGGSLDGGFNYESAWLQVYTVPWGVPMMSGFDSQSTVIHELGHAFYYMCNNKLSADKVQAEWTKCNGKAKYTGKFDPDYDKTAFSSIYGATSYSEDFAEVLDGMFESRHSIYRDAVDKNSKSGLAKKEKLMLNLFDQVLTDPKPAKDAFAAIPEKIKKTQKEWQQMSEQDTKD